MTINIISSIIKEQQHKQQNTHPTLVAIVKDFFTELHASNSVLQSAGTTGTVVVVSLIYIEIYDIKLIDVNYLNK